MFIRGSNSQHIESSRVRKFQIEHSRPAGHAVKPANANHVRYLPRHPTKKNPTSMVTCRALKEEILDASVSQILPSLMPDGIRQADPFAAAGRFARLDDLWVMSAAVLRNSDRCCSSGKTPGPGCSSPDHRLLHERNGNQLRPVGRRGRDNCSDTALPESCPNETARSAPWCSSNPAESYQLAGRRSDRWR